MSGIGSAAGKPQKEIYEFGCFRLELGKRELMRDGKSIALTPKTFQLLLVLLRHSNEVVTKDELMKALWPDTYVEETNLTRNIFDLRKALGESEQSRYIVTVPGQGYRLAKDVHLVQTDQVTLVTATTSTVQVKVEEKKALRLLRWIGPATVLLLVAGGMSVRFLSHYDLLLSERDTVVLADFNNSTGDPVFDGTLREGMAVQLEQSPFLSLISEQTVRRTLTLMGQPADVRFTGDVAREVCERTGATAVIEGSISTLGSQYVLGLHTRNCHTGDVLDEEQEQVARKEAALNGLTHIASKFRSRVGESLASIQKHSTPLAEATTPSLEALKAYSAGWRIHALHGASAALPFFKRATEIDSQFAMAYASLGRMYADLDQRGFAAENLALAWQLRDRASEREKFVITSLYQTLATGNLEAAQQTCEAWSRAYPREGLPHFAMAGAIHKVAGRYEKALDEARKGMELEPDFWLGYYGVGVNNQFLGHLDQSEKALNEAISRGFDADEFIMLAYDVHFLKGDKAGMEHDSGQARARPGGENWMSARESFVSAYSGHLRQAREISRSAVIQAQQAGQPERAALWQAGSAVREAFFGNKTAAVGDAVSALRLSRDPEIEYGAALAFALSGDSSRTQSSVADLEKRFPEDSSVRFNYLPTIRAVIALNGAGPATALESLEVAAPHDLGIPPSGISGLFGALYPVYFRGLALLAADNPTAAAAEFQKILDHRGIVVSDPIGALARLQLGRAYALSRDNVKAKSAYQDFLTLWKDADRDIPILRQAQAEYAKLQ
jgi:eukaryotic-like serine/threonine-protein kinase